MITLSFCHLNNLRIKYYCKLLTELIAQYIPFLPLVNLLTYFIFLLILAKFYFLKLAFVLCVVVFVTLISLMSGLTPLKIFNTLKDGCPNY